MPYRYSASSEWGGLFGLSPQDLEIEQLNKIEFSKLIELVPQDQRVEKIVGDRLMKCGAKDIQYIKKLERLELKNLPYLRSRYNECIKTRDGVLEKEVKTNWSHNRDNYVIWDILDSSNRAKEFVRLVNNQSSIVALRLIDYDWLYENYSWLGDQVTEHVMKGANSNNKAYLISNLPEEPGLRHIDKFAECHPSIFAHVLSNSYTPEKYTIKALRAIAGRKKIPSVKVTISQKMLGALPTVTRLKVLETLLIHMRGGSVTFSDISSKEDLETLLFTAAIKYNNRVQTVLRYLSRAKLNTGEEK